MAMNHDYYTLVHNYILNKGMGRVEANNIATTLAVLIPMRHDIGKEDGHVWPENSHVVECIDKLHHGQPYTRIIPHDLGILTIHVESVEDLPRTTTYGQCYYIRNGSLFMETKLNGVTEITAPRLVVRITEPLGIDIHQLSKLREKAAQQGLRVEVLNKGVDHPDNITGLAKMKQMFANTTEKMETAEREIERAEDQGGWSKPSGKIKIRDRPTNRLTRMRNNTKRG